MAIVRKKAKLSPLNMAYGIGAAIVITGAMFKFLNWRYANEMLFIGLATEAIVFFISAFELIRDEDEYQWEKVFPQLTSNEPTNIEKMEELFAKANLDASVVERLAESISNLEQNVSKLSSASNTAHLQEQLDKMAKTTESYETELSKLNANIAKLSNVYDKMLNAMQSR